MEREQIKIHLARAEFTDVQADALAEILSGMATKNDLRELRNDLKEDSHELRAEWKEELYELRGEWKADLQAFMREVDGKMYAFQLTVHNTLNDFRREMDQRFSATDAKIDQLGSTFSTRLERQSRKATISIIGYMTVLAAILGVVIALAG